MLALALSTNRLILAKFVGVNQQIKLILVQSIQDDFNTCLEHGVISKDATMICPVDAGGCFTDPVTDFKGMYVKDADKHIIRMLKEKGLLVKQEQHKHSYPFCYRSQTPLIYKAVPSWFIRVESLVDKLMQNNNKTYWFAIYLFLFWYFFSFRVPSFVRDKRFAK